jgi:actin-like ATPase involved in cell morphogenesis
MSTEYYRFVHEIEMATTLGLFINSKRSIEQVTFEDLVQEARRWNLKVNSIKTILADLVERLPEALSLALESVPQTPEQLARFIGGRIRWARDEMLTMQV